MEWYGLFTRDRVGRGTIHIDAVTLSVLGGIQPGKLKWLTGDALQERRGDDGLLQRLQLLARDNFREFLRRYPHQAEVLLEITAARWRNTLRRLAEQSFLDVPG